MSREMLDFFLDLGLYINGLDYSPITGASSGNIEFLVHLSNYKVDEIDSQFWYRRIPEIVAEGMMLWKGDDFNSCTGKF